MIDTVLVSTSGVESLEVNTVPEDTKEVLLLGVSIILGDGETGGISSQYPYKCDDNTSNKTIKLTIRICHFFGNR